MVYFGKKQGGGTLPPNTATTDGNNTFTGNNTFNNAITTSGITSANNGDISISPNGSGRIQIQSDIVMNNHYIAQLATPNSAQDAANKEYVDNQINTCAKLATDNTFTANNTFNNAIITTGINTTNNANLTLSPDGTGTIQAQKDIVMNNHQISGLSAPTQDTNAATKSYVDGIVKQKEIVLSSAEWKNTINSKFRVYGWTSRLTTTQKNNVIGVELFVNAAWDHTGNNTYVCTFANYDGELKVIVSRYDGQNITDATLDACTIKIRYVENITTVA